jgi:hypothetical protein
LRWIKDTDAGGPHPSPSKAQEEAVTAPTHIPDVLVVLTQEGQENEPSDAIGYGLSLASAARAHLTI